MELFFGLIALVAVGYLVYHANTSKKEVKPVEATPEAKPVVEATSVVADAAPAKPAKKAAKQED